MIIKGVLDQLDHFLALKKKKERKSSGIDRQLGCKCIFIYVFFGFEVILTFGQC